MFGEYEIERTEPRQRDLVRIAEFFKVNEDDLLRRDMSKLLPVQPQKDNLRILVTTVDIQNQENIEFVPRLVVGLEYISRLPVFQVPFLPKSRKYRVFLILRDSTSPLLEGMFAFVEYIEDWRTAKNGTVCIVITKDEGGST